ncbi:MAG: glycosyl transferase [Alphaproteobacteria bacterium]|jgi:glycosyltransferase involved in cell wall biosynthesis|nr:glycosyl transferase [Alphaproteobacteria bacterium]
MNLAEITPLILTYNEAANIGRSLQQLSWASRVVVVDSGSTDATVELTRAFANVEVFHRPFDTHAAQWNFGLTGTRIDTEWVLALDADYGVDEAFVDELRRLVLEPQVAGYQAAFLYCLDGVALRGSLYPPVTVLFRRTSGHYLQDGHTQRLALSGRAGTLSARLRHDDRKSLQHWLPSQARYMALEAEKLRLAPWDKLDTIDRLRRLRVVAPAAVFLYCLFGKGLIFDGRAGLLYAMQRATAEMVLSLTLLREDLKRRGKGQ